jgi:hypothetical protein
MLENVGSMSENDLRHRALRARKIAAHLSRLRMRKMPKIPNLEKWFDRLVRNKMHGPALATAGIAIGLVIMTVGLFPWGQLTQHIVTVIGLTHVAASSLLFVAFAALPFYKSL